MIAVAIVLMTIGSIGVCAAVLLEMKHQEPIYKLLMKAFPWVFGIGAVILGITIAGG